MRSRCIAAFLSVFLILSLSNVNAQVLYQPRIIAGYLDYELSVESNVDQVLGSRVLASEIFGGEDSNSVATNISDSFAVVGLGLTAISGKYFADIYIQDSISGGFEDNDFFVNLPTDINSSLIGSGDIDRRDFAVSVGHAFDSGFSVSVGFKSGITEFTQDATLVGEGFTTDYEFDISGAFAAVSYGKKIGSGVLAVNVAVADLSTDYNFGLSFFQFDAASIAQGAPQRENIVGSIDGGATGVTFGLSWKAPFPWGDVDNLSYSVSIDTYDYDIDLAGSSVQLVGGDIGGIDAGAPVELSANFDEQVTSFKIALQYLF